jgi:1-deoxy-D-xylulose-5-phosphate reductoisomerase
MSARTVTILGATGSVGRATLDLIERAPEGAFDVVALTANSQADDLARLAIRTRAKFCAVADPEAGAALEAALQGSSIRSAAGPDAVCEAARKCPLTG